MASVRKEENPGFGAFPRLYSTMLLLQAVEKLTEEEKKSGIEVTWFPGHSQRKMP